FLLRLFLLGFVLLLGLFLLLLVLLVLGVLLVLRGVLFRLVLLRLLGRGDRDVPQADRAILADGHEHLVVAGKDDAGDAQLVALQLGRELLSGDVPDLDHAVSPRRGKHLAVWRKGERVDRAVVRPQVLGLLPVGRVPQADGLVLRPRPAGQDLAVG